MRLPNWYRVERNGVRFYQAWNLQEAGLVKHGFSTRTGGVSSEPYESLNLGLGTDDDPSSVIANRRAFASALEVDPDRIVVPQQAHRDRVQRVGDADAGRGARAYADGIPETDALVTNEAGLTLALHFADCVCVFLLDPVKRAIGVAHAGWRGTAAKIVPATVETMVREFGSDPGTLLAAVGPAISRHCYEVGPDVASEFSRVFPHDERVMKQASSAKWWVDLKTANRLLLQQSGLPAHNIAMSDKCTSCDRDEFFSHRRDGPTGRMSGWMALA